MFSEQALLAGAQRLDERTLAEVYDRFSPGLYRYAIRLLGDPESAEDCVAETFSRFLHALHRGGGPRQHMQAYLYRVAHNWITDFYRRGPPVALLSLELVEVVDHEMEPSQAVQQQLERERVRAALAFLTPDQRQVIVLRFLEGWSNREVAEALEKPVGAVKALQHRGLAALKKRLIKQEEFA